MDGPVGSMAQPRYPVTGGGNYPGKLEVLPYCWGNFHTLFLGRARLPIAADLDTGMPGVMVANGCTAAVLPMLPHPEVIHFAPRCQDHCAQSGGSASSHSRTGRLQSSHSNESKEWVLRCLSTHVLVQ